VGRRLYNPLMAHIDKPAPGQFCWMELSTTDQGAAKDFYSKLFGWKIVDRPMGPAGVYTIFQLEDRDCAACATMQKDAQAQGVPPYWLIYIAVASADESAKKVTDLGGKVLAGPFDIGPPGRMAMVQDPTGAHFALWEGKATPGIGISGVPGAFSWADLNTDDRAKARKFYEGLFGWVFDPGKDKTNQDGYLHIGNNGHFQGGMLPDAYRNKHAPPHWLIYFSVTNCAASTAEATKLGAKVYVPPMTIENQLTYSVLGDPQGAAFALFQSHGS
jgi:uncharacterized protein